MPVHEIFDKGELVSHTKSLTHSYLPPSGWTPIQMDMSAYLQKTEKKSKRKRGKCQNESNNKTQSVIQNNTLRTHRKQNRQRLVFFYFTHQTNTNPHIYEAKHISAIYSLSGHLVFQTKSCFVFLLLFYFNFDILIKLIVTLFIIFSNTIQKCRNNLKVQNDAAF